MRMSLAFLASASAFSTSSRQAFSVSILSLRKPWSARERICLHPNQLTKIVRGGEDPAVRRLGGGGALGLPSSDRTNSDSCSVSQISCQNIRLCHRLRVPERGFAFGSDLERCSARQKRRAMIRRSSRRATGAQVDVKVLRNLARAGEAVMVVKLLHPFSSLSARFE